MEAITRTQRDAPATTRAESSEPQHGDRRRAAGSNTTTRGSKNSDHDEIAVLAYRYFLNRDGNGSAEEDWFRAERELRGGAVSE